MGLILTLATNDGATFGFEASYKDVHAPDEGIDISTLTPVCRAYRGVSIDRQGTPARSSQTRAAGLRRRGHGLRRPDNIREALERELGFYLDALNVAG